MRALYGRMEIQKQEDVLRGELIDVMKAADVVTCELDGFVVTLEHQEKDKVKVKKQTEDE